MKKIVLTILAASLAFTEASALELTGTAYTITYKGPTGMASRPVIPQTPTYRQPTRRYPQLFPLPSTPSTRYPTARPSTSIPEALSLINGRNGQELARAQFDARIEAYFFNLPFNLQTASPEVCLVLKNAAGTSLPVRDEARGDDGYAFRNPLWEKELARVSELNQLRVELKSLNDLLENAQQEYQRLRQEQASAGMPEDACVMPPPAEPPARPAKALTEEMAQRIAGTLCALKWEHQFIEWRVDPSRLFGEAGLAEDWRQRDLQRGTDSIWTEIKLKLAPGDDDLILNAAVKGHAYLEHADGIRAFNRAHGTCRANVAETAAMANREWEAAKSAVRDFPTRSVKQCEARLARREQLRQSLSSAPAYREALGKRIAELEAISTSASESRRLDNLQCRDI